MTAALKATVQGATGEKKGTKSRDQQRMMKENKRDRKGVTERKREREMGEAKDMFDY